MVLPEGLPSKCGCSSGFTVDHAMFCSSGGFPTIRHNKLRDFTLTVLSEVCHDVAIEPVLQRLTGENLHYATANVEDEARLDVSARGFWSASSYHNTAVASLYRQFEQEKQRRYEQRVREVEMGLFTPLSGVFDLWKNGWCCYHCTRDWHPYSRPVLWYGDVLAALLSKLFFVAVCYNLPLWS